MLKTPAIEDIDGEERKWNIFAVLSSTSSVRSPLLQVQIALSDMVRGLNASPALLYIRGKDLLQGLRFWYKL